MAAVSATLTPRKLGIIVANPLTLGTYRVWQRNRDVFFKLWRTELWPPFVEALLGLAAFGYGLGSYVRQDVEGFPYLHWLAPGLVMSTVLFTSAFECMFGMFIRMDLQKTFDAMIATPISVDEVVGGEIIWAATRATFTGTSVVIVLAALGLIGSWWALLVPFVAFLTAFMIGSLAAIVTSRVTSFTTFNYFITLGVIPMQLFSGTYFPVSQLPEGIRWLISLSPLYPAVQLTRDLFLGRIGFEMFGYLAWMVALATVFYLIATNLMHRRLIR